MSGENLGKEIRRLCDELAERNTRIYHTNIMCETFKEAMVLMSREIKQLRSENAKFKAEIHKLKTGQQ